MGASRDNTSDDYPKVMYWVSKRPGDIDSLDFAGRRDDPRCVPCGWMNYMNFARAKGLSDRRRFWRYAVRNAITPQVNKLRNVRST